MGARKPVVVIVPGFSEGTKPFDSVSSLLIDEGYEVGCISIPTTGRPSDSDTDLDTLPTWQDNFAAVHEFVSKYVDTGKDVVLVCHSVGGVWGTAGIVGLEKSDRTAQGLSGGVVRIVLLTAGVAYDGMKQPAEMPFLETVGEKMYIKDPVELGFNDLSPDDAKHWASVMSHEPTRGTVGQEAQYTGWHAVPCTYLLCQNDKIIPEPFARWIISQIPDPEVVECDAGHFVNVSQPKTVVDLVLRLCRDEEAKS